MEEATAIELLAHIQREALIASGVSPADAIRAQNIRAGRLRKLAESEPLPLDSAPAYAHINLARYGDLKQLKKGISTPFEDPLLYAWLVDCWKAHENILYGDTGHPIEFLIGTAPTGRFNALALRGSDGNAVVFEDGLIFFAQRAAAIISKVLFTRIDSTSFIPKEIDFRDHNIPEVITACEDLTNLVLSYLQDGYVTTGTDRNDAAEGDFSLRHVIFLGLISFVFEHEIYHLREFDMVDKVIHTRSKMVTERFEALWNFVGQAFKDEPRVTFDRQKCETLFNAHSEEHFADLNGLVCVATMGEKNNTLVPSLDGALLFFFLADSLDHAQRTILDKNACEAMDGMNDVALILNSLVFEESHPNPILRINAVEQWKSGLNLRIQETIDSEISILRQLFSGVKSRLKSEIAKRGLTPDDLHSKWAFDAKSLF